MVEAKAVHVCDGRLRGWGPVQRWNPWNFVLAVVLVAIFFTLELLLGVDFTDALVDAPLTGFILWVILEYRRG